MSKYHFVYISGAAIVHTSKLALPRPVHHGVKQGGRKSGGGVNGTVEGTPADAGGVPRQHLASAEGIDGDAVRSAPVTAVEAPWLEYCHHSGRGQGPVEDVVEGCVARQAAWVPSAGEVVVAQFVAHGTTATLVRLLNWCAETQRNSGTDCLVGEKEAEFLHWEGREPSSTVWCAGGEEAGPVHLVGVVQEVVQPASRGQLVEVALVQWLFGGEVRDLAGGELVHCGR